MAASLPADGDFWQAYYGEADLSGIDLLDPFVGGGTSVVEARRLGASVVGVDVDPVACAVTEFETRAENAVDPLLSLPKVRDAVASDLAPYYQTTLQDGEVREVLHFFWCRSSLVSSARGMSKLTRTTGSPMKLREVTSGRSAQRATHLRGFHVGKRVSLVPLVAT